MSKPKTYIELEIQRTKDNPGPGAHDLTSQGLLKKTANAVFGGEMAKYQDRNSSIGKVRMKAAIGAVQKLTKMAKIAGVFGGGTKAGAGAAGGLAAMMAAMKT